MFLSREDPAGILFMDLGMDGYVPAAVNRNAVILRVELRFSAFHGHDPGDASILVYLVGDMGFIAAAGKKKEQGQAQGQISHGSFHGIIVFGWRVSPNIPCVCFAGLPCSGMVLFVNFIPV